MAGKQPSSASSAPSLPPCRYATHVCSYACFTQQFVPGGKAAPYSSCWLSQAPAGSGPGAQCATW